jgi:hypothetical protein
MKKENRIVLDSGIHKTLYGKIVDTYAFSKGYEDCGESGESSHLIIKFTDGTFICVGIGTDEWDCYNNTLDNKYCAELSNYRSIPHYIDIHGNFHLANYIREQIEMGVIEPMSDEKIDEIINNELEERRKNRYKQYLKLKEEFEN